jgi:tetratricopeptide (TPR) repeat protein
MPSQSRVLFVAAGLALSGVAFQPLALAAGGGAMSAPSAPMPERERSPDDMARESYNDGVRYIHKADDAENDATKAAADAAKHQKLADKSADYYRKALAKFQDAVQILPDMYQSWNYIGYAQRHLGIYDEALAAYDHALTLKPDYAEAIEYRGHAYLGLNRLDDAKNAYLALFPANRKLAGQLLGGMQSYLTAHRAAPAGSDATALEAFAEWVDERITIAGQTAALTREGAAAAWR